MRCADRPRELLTTDAPDGAEAHGMNTAGCINNPRILLYSLDPRRSRMLYPNLCTDNWRVIGTSDRIEALAAVKNRGIDLAILHTPLDESVDTDLPNILRGVSPMPYLPVIVIAVDAEAAQRARFLNCGADDVICEQAPCDEVKARMAAMLRIKELYDRLSASRSALEQALQRERKLMGRLRRDNERLQKMCVTDPLTHVQNVRSFDQILDHEFKAAKRYGNALSFLMLDIDHFKVVNDTHGHPSGDYVLKELAVILNQSVRESDVVARAGGEEFCVLLPKAGAKDALRFAERVRKHVYGRKFIVYGQRIHITVSIGIATFPADAEITEPTMLSYCADQALLVAKETGRDRVVVFGELPRAMRLRIRAGCRATGRSATDAADFAPDDQPAVEAAV